MALDFSNSKVLIVGDIMLDKYYFGSVERISPEAPVPVVNIKKEENRLGGAANVANNICELGGQAFLCGTIGYDFFGKEVERITRDKHISASLLRTQQPTITKARIIGGKQQIVRLDYEENIRLTSEEEQKLLEHITSTLSGCRILVISDYGKGLITEHLCQEMIRRAHERNITVIVDPKGTQWKKYDGADIITPNVKELCDILGYRIQNEDADIEQGARTILQSVNIGNLLVTRSEKGMSLVNAKEYIHIPTHSEEVFDVSGAGDTVVATLSICLAAGLSILQSIKIANVAAGVVVKKIGTATLSAKELNESVALEK